jgi:hypothetical protein
MAHAGGVAREYFAPMAKQKGFVKTLEEIADVAMREHYVEVPDPKGGTRFKLDADELEDVTQLKSTVTALRKEVKEFKDRVEPLAEIPDGTDVAAVIAAGTAELERRATGKPIPEVESIRTQLTNAHKKELEKRDKTIASQMDTLRETLIENEVRAASADPAIKGNAKLLLPHFGPGATDIVANEDPVSGKVKYSAVILGEDKTPLVDAAGKPLTIKARLAQLRENEDYYGAFEGSGASGSGAQPVGAGGMPLPPRTPGATDKPDARTQKTQVGDYAASL